MQLAISQFGESADGDLTASAQTVEEGALASSGSEDGIIVQERKMLACGRIAVTDFDAKRSLPGGGAHDFRGKDPLDQFRLAQAL
jgi:hypothetical protein